MKSSYAPESLIARYGLNGDDEDSKSRKVRRPGGPQSTLFGGRKINGAEPERVNPPVPRELMEAMLFDDRDSLNSDEDWGAFHEHEAAMM